MHVGVNTILPQGVLADYARRYLKQALRAAAKLQDATQFTVFAPEGGDAAWGDIPVVALPRPPAPRWWRGEHFAPLAAALAQHRIDVLLSPLAAASFDVPTPKVFYALDLHPWEPEPGKAQEKLSHGASIRRACAAARALVAPSGYVRKRLQELFDVPLNKTVVAPPGVPEIFVEEHAPMAPPPYLLCYDDGRAPEKLRQLVQALRDREFTLILAGPGNADPALEDVVRIEQCPDAQMAALYQHCATFICPGRSDGGASRIIEALGAGCCVVTPHGPAPTELAGDAPFYYNPDSRASFLQGLQRSLDQGAEERQQRIRHGKAVAARFSWDETAWKLLSALKRK